MFYLILMCYNLITLNNLTIQCDLMSISDSLSICQKKVTERLANCAIIEGFKPNESRLGEATECVHAMNGDQIRLQNDIKNISCYLTDTAQTGSLFGRIALIPQTSALTKLEQDCKTLTAKICSLHQRFFPDNMEENTHGVSTLAIEVLSKGPESPPLPVESAQGAVTYGGLPRSLDDEKLSCGSDSPKLTMGWREFSFVGGRTQDEVTHADVSARPLDEHSSIRSDSPPLEFLIDQGLFSRNINP